MEATTDNGSTLYHLLIHSAEQLVCLVNNGQKLLKGEQMNDIVVMKRRDENDGLSIIVGNDGKIIDLGYDSVILEKLNRSQFKKIINAKGKCVLPGFVDAHTHPVWAGDRVNEFAMKLAGATYMDIHRAGGGIHFTVEHTRKATETHLYELLESRLNRMIRAGTTLVECKSGYGLEGEAELKMLRVLETAKRKLPIEISSTFCGAHAIPRGMTPEEATQAVINQHLPVLKAEIEKGEVNVDNIDVFCEEGVFSIEQSKRILEAGRILGLRINFHGDELHHTGSAEMGAELGAEAISHLEEISDEGIAAMASKESIAVLLPTTAYILRLKSPPVRKMIEAGVPVALGTDFNPNAYCLSMPLTMHLACIYFRMSMTEALVAATLNAAASIGRSHTHGSIEKEKYGDFVIINTDRWEHIIYQMGGHDHIIQYVIKKGEVVYTKIDN
ncbi:putative imidazolonepropionase [Chamberlinius hualienensis]